MSAPRVSSGDDAPRSKKLTYARKKKTRMIDGMTVEPNLHAEKNVRIYFTKPFILNIL